MYLRELTVRYRLRRVAGARWPEGPLANPAAAASVLVPMLRHEIVEVCGVLCLSTRLEVIAYHEMSRGTIDSSIVHPRDVFRTALLAHAGMVVLGHNHPSGSVMPSPEDTALTRRLTDAGELLGIPFADHIIVAASGEFFSFREHTSVIG